MPLLLETIGVSTLLLAMWGISGWLLFQPQRDQPEPMPQEATESVE